jgi:hypothetical protein
MQRAVERPRIDQITLCVPLIPAASQRPSRDAALRKVVDSIAVRTGALLESINYNVEVCRLSAHCLVFANLSFGIA